MAPLRVQLKPNQLAAALHLAGVTTTSRSPVSALPAVSTDAAARKSLQGTGLLDGGREGMTATTKAGLMALGDPRLLLVILANRSAQAEWVETMLLTHGPGQPFVAFADDGRRADLAILPTPAHALVLIDELAGLSSLPAASGVPPVELDVAAFAALAATADVVQASRLEARLDRQTDATEVTLTPDMLEDALDRGMEAADPRWVVDAARAVSPPVFAAAAGRMAEGLAGLQAAGFVSAARGGSALTGSGTALTGSLGRLTGSAGVTIAAADDDGAVGASQLGVLRTLDSIWMVAWDELSSDDARVTLYQASATTALRLMNSLVDPLSTGGAEGAASVPARRRTTRTARVRRGAAPTSEASPTPARTPRKAPPPAQAVAPWTETHLVPQGGMAAWAVPDGSQGAVANLDADLPVQVVEEQNGWAHIVCSNGWEAWVDGRKLVSV